MDDIDEDGFKKFNIYVDKVNIGTDLIIYNMVEYSDIIFNSLDKAAGTLQKLLKVKPLKDHLRIYPNDLYNIGIYSWDRKKFGTILDMSMHGIDLIIFPKIACLGGGVVAQASLSYTQAENDQPVLGIVKINRYINFTMPNIEKYIESTLIHEFTHILGFLGLFFNLFNMTTTKEDKYGIKRT